MGGPGSGRNKGFGDAMGKKGNRIFLLPSAGLAGQFVPKGTLTFKQKNYVKKLESKIFRKRISKMK